MKTKTDLFVLFVDMIFGFFIFFILLAAIFDAGMHYEKNRIISDMQAQGAVGPGIQKNFSR